MEITRYLGHFGIWLLFIATTGTTAKVPAKRWVVIVPALAVVASFCTYFIDKAFFRGT